jgi:oxygen-independent coproporphyrinogen III oxidase
MTNYSLYFHIPFCVHRCAYCDFNTYAGQESLIPEYVDALVLEIQKVAASAPERLPVHTIFFGGGTPSLLAPTQFERILSAVRASFRLVPSETLEASFEANPGTVSAEGLIELRQIGFNRISFGVQSAHPDELRQLERIHDFYSVIQSVQWARQAGFDNLNLDLIYGLPEQSLDRWQDSLRRVLALEPEHLSLYALTLEHGTPFGRWAARGLMPLPDPDLAADMYEWAEETLENAGYEHYEISNWAKPGRECFHNLQYWRGLPYLGLGAGAHGFAGRTRVANVLRVRTYLERCREVASGPFPVSPATVNRQAITPFIEMQETMMTGLRLTQEGVSATTFRERFDRTLTDVFGKEIDELIRLGLLEWDAERIRLTKHGRLLGNQVFMRFVD